MNPFDQLRDLFRRMADGDLSVQGAEMQAVDILNDLEKIYENIIKADAYAACNCGACGC